MALPKVTDQWILEGDTGFDCLAFQKSVPIPQLGDYDCLVEVRAVSLNYRDLTIAKGSATGWLSLSKGTYLLPYKLPLVPCSDASGIVRATGPSVTDFKPGDAVVSLTIQGLQHGRLTAATHATCLGSDIPGTLRRHMVLPAAGLLRMPSTLSFEEGSTISGAAITAWNALFGGGGGASGSGSGSVRPGHVVLTQGTGAVSLFAVQFALAAGARVIATTSSEAKAERLRALGAQDVINYLVDESWGETARGMTAGGEGVDFVVDVGGAGTLGQSLKALRYEGTVIVAGFLTGLDKGMGPGLLETLPRAANVRAVLNGTKSQFEEMNRALEVGKVKPVIDERVFAFEESREAFRYLWEQRHVGKVVIKVA